MPESEEPREPRLDRFLGRTPIAALRVVQFAFDFVLVVLITVVPVALTLLLLPRNPDGSLGSLLVTIPVIMLLLVAAAVLSWWYFARLPATRAGQTPAMRLLGLQVLSMEGSPATGGQLTLRWLLLAADAMFFGMVGLIAILISPRGQRLGDEVAGTLVVRMEPAPPA